MRFEGEEAPEQRYASFVKIVTNVRVFQVEFD